MADGPAMHPIVFDFPSWTPEEREEFKAGLAESKSPIRIVTWNGLCIDGRHRVEMCRELGIEFECDEFEGTEEEAMRLAWKLNNNRRHWKSKGEQQLAAGKLAERYRLLRLNSDRVPNGTTTDKEGSKSISREQASADTGVPARTVARAQEVIRDGSKKLQDAVKDGTVSVADAAAVADQPKAAQNAAVDSVASGEAKTLKAAVAPKPLCVGCERRLRKKQPLPKGCQECKALRPPKKPPKKPAASQPVTEGDANEGEFWEPPPPIKDAAGFTVPSHVVAAFEAAKATEAACREIDKVIAYIRGMTKGSRLTHRPSMIDSLRKVRGQLWISRPQYVCPYCKGVLEEECEWCKPEDYPNDGGWVDKHTFSTAPEEKRLAMEVATA